MQMRFISVLEFEGTEYRTVETTKIELNVQPENRPVQIMKVDPVNLPITLSAAKKIYRALSVNNKIDGIRVEDLKIDDPNKILTAVIYEYTASSGILTVMENGKLVSEIGNKEQYSIFEKKGD